MVVMVVSSMRMNIHQDLRYSPWLAIYIYIVTADYIYKLVTINLKGIHGVNTFLESHLKERLDLLVCVAALKRLFLCKRTKQKTLVSKIFNGNRDSVGILCHKISFASC